MWDTAYEIGTSIGHSIGPSIGPSISQGSRHLSHDLPCSACGHAVHTFLPCGDACDCPPVVMPGSLAA